MVIRSGDLETQKKIHMRGGEGSIFATPLISQEHMIGRPTMFNCIRLVPGSSIGIHTHQGENEVFFVISGAGKYHDNGVEKIVYPGDVCINPPGETHGIDCSGKDDLVMVAMIQKEE